MGESRQRVALVTCSKLPDLYEDDLLLVKALADLGIASSPAVWDDHGIDWNSFDAIVIRSPWDYFERVAEFRAWLDARAAGHVPLCNPLATLSWNFDKGYLTDLERAGVPIVPTVRIAKGENEDIAKLAGDRGWSDIIVKPTISGGAYRLHRFRIEEIDLHRAEIARTLDVCGVLVQPFLPEIQTSGELSLLFFGGAYSHAVRKRPKPGDFRVQFSFGGTSEIVEVDSGLVAQAARCIAHAPTPLAYARVDGVVSDGQFLLMELEVFEPLMFLSRHPGAPARFARAIQDVLAPARPA
ncbi:MAG: hypothetical protein SF028_13260 [Candidatus Sumerlaeia bacterium]|nr:hypothetical protein [Candidatus Sumerlaeia bacterium]